MKKLLSNPKKYNHIIVIEALLLTLAIHGIFVFLFKAGKPERNRTAGIDVNVSLLNFNQLPPEERIELERWMASNSPEIAFKSGSHAGFDRNLQLYNRTGFADVPLDCRDNPDSAAVSEEKFILPATSLKVKPEIPGSLHSVSLPENNKSLKYPFAIGSDGTFFQLTFSVDEEKKLKEKKVKNSAFKLYGAVQNGMLNRLSLIESSGSLEFDNLALKLLGIALYSKENTASDGTIYTVYYGGDDYD